VLQLTGHFSFTADSDQLFDWFLGGKLFFVTYDTRGVLRVLFLQPENCENRNDPDLVQAFLKKWWVESDFKAPNRPLSLWFKGSACHYNSI
jgi:hypothetical protein